MKAILIAGYPNSGKSSIIRAMTGMNFSYRNMKFYYLFDRNNNVIKVCAIHIGALEYFICPECYFNIIGNFINSITDLDLFINALDILKTGRYGHRKCKICNERAIGDPCAYIEALVRLGFSEINIVIVSSGAYRDIKRCIGNFNSGHVNFLNIDVHDISTINSYFDPVLLGHLIRQKIWP